MRRIAIRREIEDLAALLDPVERQRPANGFLPYRPFPVDALPKPVADMVLAVSRMVGCDPVFAALPAMTVLACDCSKTDSTSVRTARKDW